MGLIPYAVGKEGLSVVEALSIVDRVVSKIQFVLMERTIPSNLRIDLLRLRCDVERVRWVSLSLNIIIIIIIIEMHAQTHRYVDS